MGKSPYATTLPKRFFNCFPKDNSDVFNGMMRIHHEIPTGSAIEIEPSMACHSLEHMIKERKSGSGLNGTGSIKIQHYADPGLSCMT
jgi:hypothetical protein